ncbi:MAG: N-acetylmuramoyl-L-alanine amidase [Xanthomonadaceae bacterium]|jgi:N-acetylmuramoyl-L-alanine amidase|nr:N-acetylmuramoyl-L-alanine amidase [Xanthomonadaceae bacterium]
MPLIAPSIHQQPLSYVAKLEPRPLSGVDLVVIHCTELPDLATARSYGERVLYPSGTGNSGHFYIDRDGSIHAYVPLDRIAHHVHGHNFRAVGIELVNTGRYPDWLDSRRQQPSEPYPEAQIQALILLLHHLQRLLPSLRHIAGHESLDREQVAASDDPEKRVRRKLDPGPMFPWSEVVRETGLVALSPAS